jgi:hypothetical protein
MKSFILPALLFSSAARAAMPGMAGMMGPHAMTPPMGIGS